VAIHYSGHAPTPPSKGNSFEHVELKAILYFSYSCYFQHSSLYENKRTSSKLLILFAIILNECKIRHADNARHCYQLQIRGSEGFY